MSETVEQHHGGRRKYWIAGIVVLAVGGYVAMQYFGPYTRMVRRVRADDGVKQLQTWAEEVVGKPPAGSGEEVKIDAGQWPKVLKGISVNEVYYMKGDEGKGMEPYVRVMCGSRYYRYGLLVGRPGYKPVENVQYAYEEIGNGVWGFSPTTSEKGGGE